jgi:hypothetical protein
MPESVAPNPQADVERLEAVADQVIATYGGDVRAALKAVITANKKLQASVSAGYTRGSLPRDRKDW